MRKRRLLHELIKQLCRESSNPAYTHLINCINFHHFSVLNEQLDGLVPQSEKSHIRRRPDGNYMAGASEGTVSFRQRAKSAVFSVTGTLLITHSIE